MTRLYNGIWLQSNAGISPAIVTNGDDKVALERRLFMPVGLTSGSYMDPESGFNTEYVMGSSIDEPQVNVMYGFSYRYLALMSGMMTFDENYSLHYHDQNQVFRLGSGETLEPGPDFEVLQVCDPTSIGGVCYAALAPIDGSGLGAAARLVKSTQTLVDFYNAGHADYERDIDYAVERLNMMRTLYQLTANPWYSPLED